ncbi:MAG: N-acyl homoserine lactonase family protein [Kordiimonas sp.]
MKPLYLLVATAMSCAGFATHSFNNSIKLYALDCGTIEMFDTAGFSSEGHFSGPATLANGCFLIRHPKGDLLWDTGHDEAIADMPDGQPESWGISRTAHKLTDQLAELGLTTADIDYLALSHWHPDHSGNAGKFRDSLFLAQQDEHAFMFSKEMKANAGMSKLFAPLETLDTKLFENELDVFGDGTAVIKHMAGHTSGHSVLLVRLPESGPVLLSGDLHILEKGMAHGAVPVFNTDKEATHASQAAFTVLAEQEGARIIIQHDMAHFKRLPQFPTYLK